MYRMFRTERADMSLYKEALSMQAFNKESNNLFGYVVKLLFSEKTVSKEPWEVVGKMLTKDEYKETLKKACQMWKDVLFIHSSSTSLARDSVSVQLTEHFKHANDFLIKKMTEMGEVDIVNILSNK